jgi:hypothetical protein
MLEQRARSSRNERAKSSESALTGAKSRGKPAIEVLFKRFDAALSAAGFLAMGGQIIDATIVAAPKQHYNEERPHSKLGWMTPRDYASALRGETGRGAALRWGARVTSSWKAHGSTARRRFGAGRIHRGSEVFYMPPALPARPPWRVAVAAFVR